MTVGTTIILGVIVPSMFYCLLILHQTAESIASGLGAAYKHQVRLAVNVQPSRMQRLGEGAARLSRDSQLLPSSVQQRIHGTRSCLLRSLRIHHSLVAPCDAFQSS